MTTWTEEQLSAINEEGKNIVVSAGAGSGKTAVLSQRVLRKLKNGININELLILTFTNAAAKQMKERIRKKIKDDKSLSEQLDLIDSAYITTFDSFSLFVVKKYNYILNLSPDLSIIDSSLIRLEKEKILEKIFDQKYSSNDTKFKKLINDFCIKDDKDIKYYILSINDKLDLKLNKRNYLENYLRSTFNENKINIDIEKYEDILRDKISEISNLLSLIKTDYYYTLKDSLTTLLESKTYEEICNNINIILPRISSKEEEATKEMKENISNIIKDIQQLCKYKDKEEIKNYIYKTYDYVECIIDIILKLDKEIFDYKMKNNMFEFNDISLFAIKLLKENEDIRLEMKNYFNEIMIDEYQDTNDIQEEFISYISNNNVYMVGDIKQSIYRFRNANPYIFKNKYDNYKDNDKGIKIDLNKNFRSRQEVLNNINSIFELIMDDTLGFAEYKKSHKMVYANTDYEKKGDTSQKNDLEIYNYQYDKNSIYTKDEIEAFIIANDIKNKVESNYKIFDKDNGIIKNISYKDFVILIDKSTNFTLYKKIFEYMGIPLSINKDEKITDDVLISIIKNLILLIVKVHDREFDSKFKYLFISVSRSPLFEIQDSLIFDYIQDNNYLNSKLYKMCLDVSPYLDNKSVKDFIRLLINKFNIYENIIKIGNVSSNIVKIDYILNLTDNFSKMGYTINDFAVYLDDIINKGYDITFNENKDDLNSVNIMTIHKSKGLEYPICYYSGLNSKFNISDLNDRFMYDNKYGIITPVFDEGIDTTIYKELIKNEYIKEEISEKIRLFYVALTRAKEKMIIVCDINEDKDYSKKENGVINDNIRLKYRSFKDIILSIKENLNNYIKNVDIEKLNISKDYNMIKKTNYLDFINKTDNNIIVDEININSDIVKDESFSKKQHELIDNKTKENIDLGLNIHYLLEVLDFKNPDLDKMNISDYLKEKIEKLLNNNVFKNIENAKIYKEYEFMYNEDNINYHGIIDLMMVYDDKVDIIDYKLKDTDDDNYQTQLNGYKRYIENKLKKKVNVYLYSIIDEEIIEI